MRRAVPGVQSEDFVVKWTDLTLNTKKVQTFLAALKTGDRVVTSGGIFGSIVKVEDDHLKIEIADRVRVDISRNAVVGYQGQERVVPEPGSNA